jgi:polyhydroxybutyrate depolymerase
MDRPAGAAGLTIRLRAALAVGLVVAAFGASPAIAVHAATATEEEDHCDPCRIANGTYRVIAPGNWNGTSRLPVLMFLHGYGGEAADILNDEAVTTPAQALGVLLVAPDGLNGAWAHQGARIPLRDDRRFLLAVLADVRRRFSVDGSRIMLGGFSDGGSMVWDMACFAPLGFAAFLPFSGGFWERMPTACTAPVNLRHVHGTTDTMVPMDGKPVGGRPGPASIMRGFAIWRETDRCETEADRKVVSGELACDVWRCATRRTLELCLHPKGHGMEPEWLEDGLRWARTLPIQ